MSLLQGARWCTYFQVSMIHRRYTLLVFSVSPFTICFCKFFLLRVAMLQFLSGCLLPRVLFDVSWAEPVGKCWWIKISVSYRVSYPHPDPTFYLIADLDPEPDPGNKANADPCTSGSWSDFAVIKSWIFKWKIYLYVSVADPDLHPDPDP